MLNILVKYLVYKAIFLASINAVFSQTVNGILYDDYTEEAVENACIQLISHNKRIHASFSDSLGGFIFPRSKASEDNVLLIDHPAYVSLEISPVS